MPGVVRYLRRNDECPYSEFRADIANTLKPKQDAEMDALVVKLGAEGSAKLQEIRKADKLNDIWELRPGRFRVLYFFDNVHQHYVLLQGFRKQTRKAPQLEVRRAEGMRNDYYQRLKRREQPWLIRN